MSKKNPYAKFNQKPTRPMTQLNTDTQRKQVLLPPSVVVENQSTNLPEIPYKLGMLPTNYQELKAESKELANFTHFGILLLAERLTRIRDLELYKEDNYKSFSQFIEKEIMVKRARVYQYIDLYDIFLCDDDLLSNRIDKNKAAANLALNSSKVIAYIPILKDTEVSKEKKLELKTSLIERIPNEKKVTLKHEADKLKTELLGDRAKVQEKRLKVTEQIHQVSVDVISKFQMKSQRTALLEMVKSLHQEGLLKKEQYQNLAELFNFQDDQPVKAKK